MDNHTIKASVYFHSNIVTVSLNFHVQITSPCHCPIIYSLPRHSIRETSVGKPLRPSPNPTRPQPSPASPVQSRPSLTCILPFIVKISSELHFSYFHSLRTSTRQPLRGATLASICSPLVLPTADVPPQKPVVRDICLLHLDFVNGYEHLLSSFPVARPFTLFHNVAASSLLQLRSILWRQATLRLCRVNQPEALVQPRSTQIIQA